MGPIAEVHGIASAHYDILVKIKKTVRPETGKWVYIKIMPSISIMEN